jgi:hypothetical protein
MHKREEGGVLGKFFNFLSLSFLCVWLVYNHRFLALLNAAETQERYPVLRLGGTAKFRNDPVVPDGSTNHHSAGWLVTSQSPKSLSQSPDEVQVSHQRPQKRRASSIPSSLPMVIVVDRKVEGTIHA